jgi:hypothetical protein
MGRRERALERLQEQGFDTSGIGRSRKEETERIEGTITVDFASLAQANEIRDREDVRPYISERDDRRRREVVLDDDTPEDVADRVSLDAADATKEEAEKFGQVPLTDAEKSRIDFSQVNTLRARSIKGIAVGLGVADWTSFVDPTLTVDEHREVMKRAAREDSGGAFDGGLMNAQTTEPEAIDAFLGRAFETLSREERPRALEAAFRGDQEAAEFIRSGRSAGEGLRSIFDVSLEPIEGPGGRRDVRVGGAEGDRVAEIHEDRPPRARAVDERKRSSQITLDPLEWASNPRRWDYPGVDTLRPENIHERRSERAQAIDERSTAKPAPSVEAWIDEPGRYDLEGVDSPRSIPEEERGRGPIRLGERLDILEEEPSESLGNLGGGSWFGLAGGEEAERLFVEAEEERRSEELGGGFFGTSNTGAGGVESGVAAFGEGQEPPLELEDPGAVEEAADAFLGSGPEEELVDTSNLGSQMGLGGEAVETESQATFGFVEPDDSPDTRLEEEAASVFGVDDRSSARRGSEREREETLEAGLEAFGGGERRNKRLDELF